ncbi:dnaJ homolog subfamily C member 22 isoform 1-T2 [Spinachia spinachia]
MTNAPLNRDHRGRTMVKSVMVAYALWALGGPVGLHHLYLGRDSHALLWMLTLGGFGFGWVREAIRIPAYVVEANQEAERTRRAAPTTVPPPVSPVRFVGQVSVGIYFGTVALIGLNSLRFFYLIVLPLCVGAGVHLVSSIGQQTSDLQKTLTTCLITSPIFYGSSLSPLPISLAASVTAAQNRRAKLPRTPGNTQELGPRLYRLGLAWLAFSAPLGYCIFHNTTAMLYYLSDCVSALLDIFWFLPWLKNVFEYFLLLPYRLLCVLTGGGYYEDAWRKVLEILLKEYSEKERDALKVLSLDAEASLEDITRTYRGLAKTWHPDHNPGKEAEAMFMKIHEAYVVLLQRHRPRRFP